MNKKNNRKGFTTVELVIVIAVIAILATALIPTFGGLIDSANKTANEQEVRNIYRDYLAKDPAANASASYYIVVDGAYYLVDEGELSLTPVTVPTCGIDHVDSNLNKTDKSTVEHNYTNGVCGTCGATTPEA